VGALGMVDQEVSGVQVVGIDPVREDRTTNFNNTVIEGSPLPTIPGYNALIGKGLAKIIKAEVGDSLVLLSQGADGSIANAKYEIVGLVESGEMGGDRMNCYIDISSAQQLFVLDRQCHEIAITVNDISKVNSVTANLRSTVKTEKLDIQPWMVFAKSFYEAMKADMNGLWIQLGIIILLVAFGVLNTVLMSVLERQREFGLLKAIGTKPGMIIIQILIEMNLIALLSIITGSVVALGLLYWLSNYGISLSTPMTFGGVQIQQMNATINLRSFIIPLITVIITTTAVSILPAVKAARTDPVKTMRTN
jgi:putative ABC transport system permease protein